MRVCMKFYLRTLGYTHDTFVKNAFRYFTENTKVLPSPDKRGRHDPPHKLSADDIQSIRNHILSYHPTSRRKHCRRKHAPNRLYLAPELTIAAMQGMSRKLLITYIDNDVNNKKRSLL